MSPGPTRTRWVVAAALAVAAAMVGGLLYLSQRGGSSRPSRVSAMASTGTAKPTPPSACSAPQGGTGPLTQSPYGSISGCLLLDPRTPGAYTVSLWTLANPKAAQSAPGGPAAVIALHPAA